MLEYKDLVLYPEHYKVVASTFPPSHVPLSPSKLFSLSGTG